MKIRTDFVTNSSSSSFVVAFNNKEEGIEYFAKKAELDDRISRVLSDFLRKEPLSKEKLHRIVSDEANSDACSRLCYSFRANFREEWLKKNPGGSYFEMFESQEYKDASKSLIEDFIKRFYEELGDKAYVVIMEYGDESGGIFGELEHYVMPALDCVVRRFNHH